MTVARTITEKSPELFVRPTFSFSGQCTWPRAQEDKESALRITYNEQTASRRQEHRGHGKFAAQQRHGELPRYPVMEVHAETCVADSARCYEMSGTCTSREHAANSRLNENRLFGFRQTQEQREQQERH